MGSSPGPNAFWISVCRCHVNYLCGFFLSIPQISYPSLHLHLILQNISYECTICSVYWRKSIFQSFNLIYLILMLINSLVPSRFPLNFRWLIVKPVFVIDCWGLSCDIALEWMSSDPIDDKSTLVQVMACCLTAPSHYLSQCWPRSISPYGVTRPHCFKWPILQMFHG